MEEMSKHAELEQRKQIEREAREQQHQGRLKARSRKKNIRFGIILLVLVAGAYYFYVQSMAPGYYDNFARCLTDTGAIFYGSFECGHCKDQKQAFGKSTTLLNYIECGSLSNPPAPICQQAGVRAYPTWVIGEKVLTGFIPLTKLSEVTGCTLPNR